MDEEEVAECQAYMLFYQRSDLEDPHGLGISAARLPESLENVQAQAAARTGTTGPAEAEAAAAAVAFTAWGAKKEPWP